MIQGPKAEPVDEHSATQDPKAAGHVPPGCTASPESEPSGASGEQSKPEAAKRLLTDADMPALDSLGEDADYSGFLSAGVSAVLRKQGLRHLFSSARYNVIDGLDDYCEDFSQHTALGDVVPTELKRRLQAALRDDPDHARSDHPGAGEAPLEPEQAKPLASTHTSDKQQASVEEQAQHDNPDFTG